MVLLLLLFPLLVFASADVWKKVFEGKKVVRGDYGERAWLFENTAALVGYLSGKWKGVRWEEYVGELQGKRGEDLDLLGILGGFSQNFVVEPDAKLSAKRGRALAPTFGHKVGIQQLRHAVLKEKRENLTLLEEEWKSLHLRLQSLCKSPVLPEVGQYKDAQVSAVCGLCWIRRRPPLVCETCSLVYAFLDAKRAIVGAVEVLEGQSLAKRELLCAQGLYWLSKSRASLTELQGKLFLLSSLYGAF